MKEMQKNDAEVKGAVSVNATKHLKTDSTVWYSLRRAARIKLKLLLRNVPHRSFTSHPHSHRNTSERWNHDS